MVTLNLGKFLTMQIHHPWQVANDAVRPIQRPPRSCHGGEERANEKENGKERDVYKYKGIWPAKEASNPKLSPRKKQQ